MHRFVLLAAIGGSIVTLLAPASNASTTHWTFVHFRINAYGHAGRCTPSSPRPTVTDISVTCSGLVSRGQFGERSILTRTTQAAFAWNKPGFSVHGGHGTFDLAGGASTNLTWFEITRGTIKGDRYVTGSVVSKRGKPGGPLAVTISSHTYGGVYGLSCELQGYVKAA